MKQFDITRPDKILLSGLKTLVSLPLNLYSQQKSESKSKGELTFIGNKKVEHVSTQLYCYDESDVAFEEELSSFDFVQKMEEGKVYWLNMHGLHDVDLIQGLGKQLNLDRITVRHTLDTTMRPKVQDYDHYLFFSIKSVLLTKEEHQLNVEQLSFVLGENYVVSFQEEHGDHFDHIRNKINEKLGLVRNRKASFLLYQLLDAILDNYFETIESINEDVKLVEKVVLKNPTQSALVKLEQIKQVAEMIKKSLSPFKDSLRSIDNRDTDFIDREDKKYFQELINSCDAAVEEIDSTGKSLESLTNIYFSSLSQKMNETMKVLTTVATIFIPLTFIAGIYGMNFEYMPELNYHYGYFIVWGVMIAIMIAMIIYFKRQRWL